MAPHHPVAFCFRHGLFIVPGIALGEGTRATFLNCQTNCPSRGAAAEIIPGLHQPEAGRMNVLIDPSICFEFRKGNAHEVEITDYHKG